ILADVDRGAQDLDLGAPETSRVAQLFRQGGRGRDGRAGGAPPGHQLQRPPLAVALDGPGDGLPRLDAREAAPALGARERYAVDPGQEVAGLEPRPLGRTARLDPLDLERTAEG